MRTTAIVIILLCIPLFVHAGQIGTKAPGFILSDVSGGKEVSLEQFKGKVIFLDFWATWCIPCRDELPELDRLFKKYRGEGLVIIGINVDASVAHAAAFLNKRQITFPLLFDAKGDAGDAYRVTGLPTAFLIGRDGTLRYRHGGYGKEYITMYEKEITELLKQ